MSVVDGAQRSDALTIVALQTFFTPLPNLTLPAPYTFNLVEFATTSAAQVPSRIKDADIIITTTVPIGSEALSTQTCPRLKLIVVLASGTDSVDLVTCAARGIRVVNSPDCNADAVAEHAVGLYFAVRRAIVPTMRGLRAGDWPRHGSLMTRMYAVDRPPRSCRQETVVVVGYGVVGRKVATLLRALGMHVVVAARKGMAAPEGRVAFEEGLKTASVVVLCCPRLPETLNLLSETEFELMPKDAVLVNVARGGIVDETVLVKALKDGQIAGAAVDVFNTEPASPETSPLLTADLDGLNLVVTPHTAWVGGETTANYQRVLQENIDDFFQGRVRPDRVKA